MKDIPIGAWHFVNVTRPVFENDFNVDVWPIVRSDLERARKYRKPLGQTV